MQDFNKYNRYIWPFIIAVTIARIIFAFFLGATPQETYYWNYSQHPDLSYFDHPPMTAYLIYLFTNIFGDNIFGLHFPAIFISFMLALIIFYFLRLMFDARVAFWSVVVGNTTFIFALGGLIITPDGPLLMFWMLTVFSLCQASRYNDLKWWLLTGIFLGCSMVSKYTAVLAALGVILYLISSRKRIVHFKRPGPYLAAFSSFIVFLPVIIWNYRHDWASFGFQSSRRAAEAVQLRPDYFFGFLGSQIGVLAIFLFPLFIWALVKAYKNLNKHSYIALFFWFAFPTTVLFALISPFHYVKMNWLAPSYLSALPIAVYFFFESKNKFLKKYVKFAVAFSIVVTITVHILILLPNFTFGSGDTISGWPQLAARADAIKDEMPSDIDLFICGYEYKAASQLRFYLDGQPETFSNNIVGKKGLAYDFWGDPDTLVGKNCIFVYDTRNSFNGDLKQFFDKVEEPEKITIVKGGKKVTDFYVYKCYNYRGIK